MMIFYQRIMLHRLRLLRLLLFFLIRNVSLTVFYPAGSLETGRPVKTARLKPLHITSSFKTLMEMSHCDRYLMNPVLKSIPTY